MRTVEEEGQAADLQGLSMMKMSIGCLPTSNCVA